MPDPVDQGFENLAERAVDGEVGHLVGPCRALVDDGDWDTVPRGMPDESISGHDRQRGPQHEHQRRPFDKCITLLDPRRWDVLAEEHDVGLEHSAAKVAVDDPELLDRPGVDGGVAVGRDGVDLG
jgi:hypothetical protein